MAALLVAALTIVGLHASEGSQPAGAAGLPPGVTTSMAYLMGLNRVPGAHEEANFTLVDQKGRRLSLASFKGKAVVLEFMDPHCSDICPLVAEEFVDAYHDLGKAARYVVFAAVNVNKYHTTLAAVEAFSSAHGLAQIPTWHFFTGPVARLRAVWKAYGIYVYAPGPNADVMHSSVVFFIAPDGQERYVATPTDEHTANGTAYVPGPQLSEWGRGIALVSRSLTR
jgi:cytochrome oxidase Cu insertion factor (SCO1/SenC/PrrC family)